jgi:hypothetical protein
MLTDKQLAAARANGAKSRGPVTAEGKLNSNRNNIRHGLLAETVVFSSESLPRFTALLRSLTRDLEPKNQTELSLVETMAVARWRQMRLWELERAGIERAIRLQDPAHTEEDAATRAYLAFRGETDQSRSLELIHRYEARYERQYHHIFRTFLKLRNTQIPLEPTNPLNPEAEFSK